MPLDWPSAAGCSGGRFHSRREPRIENQRNEPERAVRREHQLRSAEAIDAPCVRHPFGQRCQQHTHAAEQRADQTVAGEQSGSVSG
jgi:hypothetical protein